MQAPILGRLFDRRIRLLAVAPNSSDQLPGKFQQIFRPDQTTLQEFIVQMRIAGRVQVVLVKDLKGRFS